MAKEIQITEQKYLKQGINGFDFSIFPSDYVNNLAGLVMQKIKLIQKFRVQWRSLHTAPNADPSNIQWSVTMPSPTKMVFTREDGGNFLADGFYVNDEVLIANAGTSGKQNFSGGTISIVTETFMQVDFSAAQPALNVGIYAWRINGVTPLTSLVYNYGIIENGDNFSTNSLITTENQGYYSLGTIGEDTGGGVRDTNFVNMGGLGLPKSWEDGSCKIRFVQSVSDVGVVKEWQEFEMEHIFTIPFFQAGTLEDLENDVMPDWMQGLNTLKYVFDADFRTVLSNPNTSKKTRVENVLGSVGWFGETFNGFDSNYKINDITYQDNTTSASADGILISGTTKVILTVEKISGFFNSSDVVMIYFAYLPEQQSEVENTQTNYIENFMWDSIRITMNTGLPEIGTGILNNGIANTSPANIAVIEFTTTLTTAQKLRLNNTKSFLIGVELYDSSIAAGNSDAVILKKTGLFDESPDIDGLMLFEARNFPYSESVNTSLGFTDFKGYNEHGLAIKGNIHLNLSQDAFLNSFKAALVAYNPTANSYFILDEYDYQLPTTVSGGVQQLNMSTSRGYQLASNSEKNEVSITNIASPTNLTASYEFRFSQKIRWEDWIKNLSVDNIFYDNTKINNNFNYKTSNYSGLNGYDIRMLYLFNVSGKNLLGISGDTDYRYFSPKFIIHDYDKDDNTTPYFTQVIETFTADGLTNLGGVIQDGVDTLFKITWIPLTPLVSIANFWGIHRIHITGETEQVIYELGTFEANLPNQILKPISGSFLDMQLVSGNIVTTCLIDGSLIQSGFTYDLSGEINSPTKTGTPGTGESKILEDGTPKIKEDGTIKILEP